MYSCSRVSPHISLRAIAPAGTGAALAAPPAISGADRRMFLRLVLR